MTDPANAEGASDANGEGATGTSTPTVEELQAKLQESEEKNAKLREERRADRAKALGAEHGLSPTATELIASLPADQQEEKAKALAAEMKGQAKAPGSGGGNAPPSPKEDASDPDPALDQMGSGGSTPPATGGSDQPNDWRKAMQAEIEALAPGDFDGLKRIQAKYQERSRTEGAAAS